MISVNRNTPSCPVTVSRAAARSASYRSSSATYVSSVSNQSSVISSRSLLENEFQKLKQKFRDKDVPLPSFWGGYRVVPEQIEFWQGRRNRLHDRFQYSRDGDGWTIERLAP